MSLDITAARRAEIHKEFQFGAVYEWLKGVRSCSEGAAEAFFALKELNKTISRTNLDFLEEREKVCEVARIVDRLDKENKWYDRSLAGAVEKALSSLELGHPFLKE